MKPKSIIHRLRGSIAALLIASTSPAATASVTVDGFKDTENETEYAELAVQSITSNWGANNGLATLYAAQDGPDLAVFIGGRANGNGIILFIDSKPGGPSFIPNNLITSGGEEYTINNLGSSTSAGFTFESGFNPDYAVRIYGNDTEAHVNRYNLQTGTRDYVGQTVAANVQPSGFVEEIATLWSNIADPPTDTNFGPEMKLNLASLGVPAGTGQTVKLMAILVNGGSDYGSNQLLGSKSTSGDIGGGIKSFNCETEPGTQTLSITVDNTDTDGDNIPDDIDTDDDGDGLDDVVETDTGTYVSPTDTGTDPLIKDTDGDTYFDGDELNSTLGYVSDPNKPNYLAMTVAGNFTDPTWQAAGGALGTSMTQGDTGSLTEQYDWSLQYRFLAPANIAYKFTADEQWTHNWGDNGNDINAVIATSGFHTFTFNNVTLARSLARTEFTDVNAYLDAYQVLAGADDDNDNVLNEDEFLANTDPTNSDTDGDGLTDDVDPEPLLATRDIVFSVDMTVQEALGNFDPNSGTVTVKFFSGAAAGQPDLLLSEVGDTGVYTGTLSSVAGPAGVSFGTYKFFNTTAGAPNSGYEESDNRSFDLGDANTTQTLGTVFFGNNSTLPGGYGTWADDNAGGQTAEQDFDGDGVANGVEYFMGETGSTFTANPAPVADMISWPRDPDATGVSFRVLSSDDLATWTDVTGDADTSDPNFVKYTLPAGDPKRFVKLEVSVP